MTKKFSVFELGLKIEYMWGNPVCQTNLLCSSDHEISKFAILKFKATKITLRIDLSAGMFWIPELASYSFD